MPDLVEFIAAASAGSNYSLVILVNGTAVVGGYIEDLNSYAGHFGVDSADVSQGVNALQPITSVENRLGLTVTAPEFADVVTGVSGPDEESAGRMHSLFLDVDGNVYAAGYNHKGQLCLGDEDVRQIPTQIELPDDEIAVGAAVGAEFTLIVTDAGKVYGCGDNELGQLGLGEDVGNATTPEEIPDMANVTSVSAGLDFALIRTTEGLFAMGNNEFGASTKVYL